MAGRKPARPKDEAGGDAIWDRIALSTLLFSASDLEYFQIQRQCNLPCTCYSPLSRQNPAERRVAGVLSKKNFGRFSPTLTKVRNLPVPQPTSRRDAVSGSLSANARPMRRIDRRRMASPMPHI